jgi:hypothetical protein
MGQLKHGKFSANGIDVAFVEQGSGSLVRLAGSSFRDRRADGNESRPSWIEEMWSLVRDLDECASRDPNGRASRR